MSRPKVVATVERQNQAIDYTDIHYFRTCRPIRSGSVVRWDSAEKVLYLDDESFKSRDDVEDTERVSYDPPPLDPLFNEAVLIARDAGYASTSLLQRHFKCTYVKSAQLMDQLEGAGVIGPKDGAKRRNVL